MKTRIGITGKRLGLSGDLLTPSELEREAEYKTRVKDAAFDLLDALKAIIEECPNPKLPYGQAVVHIAKAAISKAEAMPVSAHCRPNGRMRKP